MWPHLRAALLRWVAAVWGREAFGDPRASTMAGTARIGTAGLAASFTLLPVCAVLFLVWLFTGRGPAGGYLRRTCVRPQPWPAMRAAAAARAQARRRRGPARGSSAGMALAFVAAVLLIGCPVSASASAAPRCRVPGDARVVASSPAVSVFARGRGRAETIVRGVEYFGVYACRTRDGHTVRLDGREGPTLEPNSVYGPIVASGMQVAWASNELVDQASSGITTLLRLDVATGRETAVETVQDDCACWTDVEMLPSGGIAWIRYSTDFENAPTGRREWTVLKCDAGCEDPTKLSSGRTVEPRSLSLSDRRLMWTKASRRRSATLR
jgi:hypothetical protein